MAQGPDYSRVRRRGSSASSGILAATGIALAAVALPDTFINFNAGLTDFTKVEFYIPLIAGAFIWFVAMFAYRYLVQAVPRAGGEYVFLSRIVSPMVGSVAGIGLAVVFTYVLATNATSSRPTRRSC